MNYYIDKTGYKVFEYAESELTIARFKGYCSRCHMTFWKNETVAKLGRPGFGHQDCIMAIADDTPRSFDPKWKNLVGALPDKKELKKKAKRLLAGVGNA